MAIGDDSVIDETDFNEPSCKSLEVSPLIWSGEPQIENDAENWEKKNGKENFHDSRSFLAAADDTRFGQLR